MKFKWQCENCANIDIRDFNDFEATISLPQCGQNGANLWIMCQKCKSLEYIEMSLKTSKKIEDLDILDKKAK